MATQQELYNAALQVGFDPQNAAIAAAIAMAESGGRTDATNPNGEYSVGPMQINLQAHPWVDENMARDPVGAMEIAYQISGGGSNWTPWTTFTGGNYQQYLGGDVMPGATGETTAGYTPVKIGGQIIGYESETDVVNPITGAVTKQKKFTPYTPATGSQGSVFGTQAPNPAMAVQQKINEMEQLIAIGKIPKEDAIDQFKAWYDQNTQAMDRSKNILSAQDNAQTQATQRAQIVARDVLPRATTVGSLNVPYLNEAFGGSVPGTPLDINAMFNQGQGNLPTQQDIAAMFPAPSPAPVIPNSTIPQSPDLSALIAAIAAGNPGWTLGGGSAGGTGGSALTQPTAQWPTGVSPFAGAYG